MRNLLALGLMGTVLSACVSTPPDYFPNQRPPSTSAPTRPPPQQQPVRPAPSGGAFIAPQVMSIPGLEAIIGRDSSALVSMFGRPRLQVKEGDAVKLQFAGQACVLDIYLYPLRPNAAPSATHVEARRSSDGEDVDRAACARALRK